MTDHPNLSLKESEESQGVRKPSTLFLWFCMVVGRGRNDRLFRATEVQDGRSEKVQVL